MNYLLSRDDNASALKLSRINTKLQDLLCLRIKVTVIYCISVIDSRNYVKRSFRWAVVPPIHIGTKSECSNYRGMSLLSVPG